jgi:ribonuclease HII
MDKLNIKKTTQKDKYEKELERLESMTIYEKNAYMDGHNLIAGVDEAGRGPLAGPVVAAAVVLPRNTLIPGLNDSKKLSATKRDRLYEEILEKALSYSIGIVDEKTIDEINILNAAKKAMKIAVTTLSHNPDIVLVDAVNIDDIPHNQIPIIKGDSLSISIAAASIIAKVTRDRMMIELCSKYPKYGFSKHKGYGTKEHIEAIKKEGICPIHRMSFIKNFIN